MHTFIVGLGFRPLPLSIATVLAISAAPLVDQETRNETTSVMYWHRVTNDAVPINAVPVVISHSMSNARLAVQDGNDHDGSNEFSDATIVVRWSQLAQDNAFAVDPAVTDPFPVARGWTMVYLAMHDALNAIVPKFQQYAFFGTDTSAHPIAAAAQAAHDVMNHIYPTRQAENDAELAFWLDQVPDDNRKTNGIHLGMASASAIINARANDNMREAGEYTPQNPLEPGDYRFVPPLQFVYRPAFGNATPFGIHSGSDFLPEPPPALTSWDYAMSVNEVKAFGRRNSAFRSQDQTNFGAGGSSSTKASGAGSCASSHSRDVSDCSRRYACSPSPTWQILMRQWPSGTRRISTTSGVRSTPSGLATPTGTRSPRPTRAGSASTSCHRFRSTRRLTRSSARPSLER